MKLQELLEQLAAEANGLVGDRIYSTSEGRRARQLLYALVALVDSCTWKKDGACLDPACDICPAIIEILELEDDS